MLPHAHAQINCSTARQQSSSPSTSILYLLLLRKMASVWHVCFAFEGGDCSYRTVPGMFRCSWPFFFIEDLKTTANASEFRISIQKYGPPFIWIAIRIKSNSQRQHGSYLHNTSTKDFYFPSSNQTSPIRNDLKILKIPFIQTAWNRDRRKPLSSKRHWFGPMADANYMSGSDIESVRVFFSAYHIPNYGLVMAWKRYCVFVKLIKFSLDCKSVRQMVNTAAWWVCWLRSKWTYKYFKRTPYFTLHFQWRIIK